MDRRRSKSLPPLSAALQKLIDEQVRRDRKRHERRRRTTTNL